MIYLVRMRKIITMLTILAFLLSGCSGSKKAEENADIKSNAGSNVEIVREETDSLSKQYFHEIVDIPENFVYIHDTKSIGDEIYVSGKKMSPIHQRFTIKNIDMSGKDSELLFSNDNEESITDIQGEYVYHNEELYFAYSHEGILYIAKLYDEKEEILFEFESKLPDSFCVTDDKIYVVAGDSELFICDISDLSVQSVDLKIHNIDDSNIRMYVDDSENLFFLEKNRAENTISVFKFDCQNNLLFSNTYDDMSGEVVDIFKETDTENIVISSCVYGEDSMMYINVIDPENGNTLEMYESAEFVSIYGGSTEYECIAQLENQLYGYNYSTGESTYLCDINNGGIFNRVIDISDNMVTVIEEQSSQADSAIKESVFVIDKNGTMVDDIPYIKNCNGVISRSYISLNKDIYYIEEDYNAAFIEYGRSSGTHIVHTMKSDGEHSYFEINTDNIETFPLFITADASGNIYIGEEKGDELYVTVYDNTGEILVVKVFQNYVSLESYAMCNNKLYISCNEIGEVIKCYSIDSQSGSFSEEPRFDGMSIFEGDSVYDIYIKKGTEVCGYSFETDKTTSIFSYINCGLSDFYIEKIYSIGNDEFVILGSDFDSYGESRSFFMKKSQEISSDIQLITVGGVGIIYSDFVKEIEKFNKENKNYKIICKDYDYLDRESINIDLLEGKLDIIISNSDFPVSDYNKEIFEDFLPYIEKDESLELSDYYENIISLGSENGKMYEVIPQFGISVILSLQKYFDSSDTSWTPQEFTEFINGKYSFGEIMDSDIIEQIISPCIINYVDIESKKCNFDNEDFKNMIKAVATNLTHSDFSFSSTYDLIEGSKTLEFNGITGYSGIFSEFSDEGIIFKGYPNDKGSGYIVCPLFTFLMAKNCENKDGAWEFIKYFLTKDYQDSISDGIPVMKSCSDNIFKSYSYHGESAYVDIDPKLKSQILEVIDTADSRGYYSDSRIYKIIEEEIYNYINGVIDIDSMAKSIQSRVSLYLNERE
ncbi:MAG: carbohydrate ABC transporter substrate-binding protein [Ruminococcus sp.]|nr:carbohydrate ABC transporter substrate-binding protein [Ruminococcus sp.]